MPRLGAPQLQLDLPATCDPEVGGQLTFTAISQGGAEDADHQPIQSSVSWEMTQNADPSFLRSGSISATNNNGVQKEFTESGLPNGNYLIVATSETGDTVRRSFAITCDSPALIIEQCTATAANPTGTVTLKVSGGRAPFTCAFTVKDSGDPPVQSGSLAKNQPQTFADLAPNTYVVTVSDVTGRQTSKEVTVEAYVPPSSGTDCAAITLEQPTSTPPARGSRNGTVSYTVRGPVGANGVTVSLLQDNVVIGTPIKGTDSNLNAGTFKNLATGSYTVRAVIAADCIKYEQVDVELPLLEIGDQLSFVPWVQPQLLHDADPGTGPRPTVQLGVRLRTDQQTLEDLHTTVTGQLYGPADVLGISQRAILGTTPAPGASGFSPLQLAAIEFKDEDLPWRYSTRRNPNDGTPLPWLQLLVLTADEYQVLPLAGQALPGIQFRAGIPYPSTAPDQQALWAHVQLNGSLAQAPVPGGQGGTGTTPPPATTATQPSAEVIQTFVDKAASDPSLAYSRLFCPRRLQADTDYRAFLVPALEVGRRAGLGLDTGGVALDAVASLADGRFPVYFQWPFSTGTEEDFESLLGQLHHAAAAVGAATPPALGLTLPAAATSYALPMPGLLTAASAAALPALPVAVASYLYEQLNARAGQSPGPVTQPRPLVTPPLYGRAYMVSPALLAPGINPDGTAAIADNWKHTVNLDPRYRAIAALGVQVVQANQEEYVRRAWDQVQDILLANEKLRGLQYGLRTTAGLRTQHLPLNVTTTTTTPGTGSGKFAVSRRAAANGSSGSAAPVTTTSAPVLADYGLQLTGLALGRTKLTAGQAPAELVGLTAREALRRSSTPLAAFSPAFRRITKPFGQYMVSQAGRPLRATQPEPKGPVAVADAEGLRGTSLRQRDQLLSALSSGELTAAPDRPQNVRAFQFNDELMDPLLAGLATAAPSEQRVALQPGGLDTEAANRFNQAFYQFIDLGAQADGSRDTVGFLKPQRVLPTLPLEPLKAAVVTATQPGPLVRVKIKTVAPTLPTPVVYGPGDFTCGDFTADFEVGDCPTGDWLARDFDARDFNVGDPEDASSPAAPEPTAAPQARSFSRLAAAAAATTTTTAGSAATKTLPVIPQAKVFPVFKDPMGEPLRQLHPELFVPGLGDFPAGGIAELEVNQAFIEAYLVGLNHALGSELHWRGFPVELRGTFFQQFWDVSEHLNSLLAPGESPTPAQELALLDIAPLDRWVGSPLGQNAMADHQLAPAPPAPLRLALRSELLRRYPTLVIGLQPAGSGDSGPDDDLTRMLAPRQRLAVGQDVAVVVFDKTLAQARQDGDYLLLLERPGQPTFGLDELPAGGDATADPLSWNDLTWEHLGTQPGDILAIDTSDQAKLHAATEPATVAYLTDSANLAYALFQEPILAALPVAELLAD